MVIETMQNEYLNYRETAFRFNVNNHDTIKKWEQIYLKEGAEELAIKRRGRVYANSSTIKGHRPKFKKKQNNI